MQLYVAEVVKEATIAGRAGFCELGFVLIRAETLAEAETRANAFGKAGERSYTNPAGESVVWKFVRVESVSPAVTEKFEDVTELHAQVYKSLSAYEMVASQRKLD